MTNRPVSPVNLKDAFPEKTTHTVGSFSDVVSNLTDQTSHSIQFLIQSLPKYAPKKSLPYHLELEKSFVELIEILTDNGRLGSALQNELQYELIYNMYMMFCSNPTISGLLNELKEWNLYSYYHSVDVFVIGTLLGNYCKLPNLEEFSLGCLLHDMGKRFIPKEVLTKKSKLTQAEYELVKYHANFGAVYLELMGFSEAISLFANVHHERLDGSGYPLGLVEANFNEALRLISVVDVYSALTLQRSYREPLSGVRALENLLGDHDKLCEQSVFKLAETLQIFPPQAELLLPNGLRATTTLRDKNPLAGYQLVIKENGETIPFVPNNQLAPIKMIGWKSHRLEQWQKKLWSLFTQSLINGSDKATLYFEELADGKRVESIYRDIFGKVGQEVRKAYLNGTINADQRDQSVSTCLGIMNQKLVEYTPSYQVSLKQGIVFAPLCEKHVFSLRLLHDSLFVNGWRTYFLKSVNEQLHEVEARIFPILNKPFVNTVTLSLTTSEESKLLMPLLKRIRSAKPSAKIILYYRKESFLKEIDLRYIDFYSSDLIHFLNHLNES